MKLFEVFGEVKIDDRGANKKLGTVTDKAKKLGNGFTNVTKKIGKFGLKFGAMAAVAGGAMFAFANKTTEALDRVDKLSQKLGMATDDFQKWDYVLSQNGTSVDTLKMGMKTLAERMMQAQEGAGKGAEAFEILGISATDVNGELKTQGEMFNEAVIALQGVDNATMKASLANDLFAGSAKELTPLLNQSSEATEALKLKAQELGMVQSGEAITAGAAYQDNLDTTKRMLGGIATTIGITLLPMFNKMLTWTQENMPIIKDWFKNVFEDYINPVLNVLKDIINDYVIPAFILFKEWLDENIPIIKEIIKVAFEDYIIPIFYAFEDVIKTYVIPILTTFAGWVGEWIPVVKTIFKTAFDVINPVVKELWTIYADYILPVLKTFVEWLDENMDPIKKAFETTFTVAFDVIKKVWDILDASLIPVLKTLFTWINDNSETLGNLLEAPFIIVNTVIQATIGFIDTIITGLGKVVEAAITAIEWLSKVTNAETGAFANGGSTGGSTGGDGHKGYTKNQEAEAEKIEGLSDAEIEAREDAIGNISTNEGVDLSTAESIYENQTRATGGPVKAGETYLVGENEPELFVPNKNGQIYNQNQMKGLGGITQNITINSAKALSPYEIAKRIKQDSRKLAMNWG